MVVKYTRLMDTIWALVLPGAVQVFNMLVVMNYMRSLPKELEGPRTSTAPAISDAL